MSWDFGRAFAFDEFAMEELLAAVDERIGSNPVETTRKRQMPKTTRFFVH